ncbi:hypothetical protein [Planomicrobium sp. Y74]|uniref:hypothetical protein n=1 Tax=Planomicrobium sp. Y74 TaxID=2478977 RepID=UPI000EF497D1|nr:hypothetical protein [Planomicrobium sp. Y74]RLQ91024.1 hypothetical protein D9754_09600 [Planomicrobium sp. Y74]
MTMKFVMLFLVGLMMGGCGKMEFVQEQVEKNYTNADGLIHAYPTEQDSEYLSETIGLYMEYLVLVEDEENFSKQVELLKSHFLAQEKDYYFIRWRLNENAATNALIDDIRIITALEQAAGIFGNENYKIIADQLSEAVSSVQSEGGYTVDFYDWSLELPAQRLTLSYLDDNGAITAESYELLNNVNASEVFFPEYYDTAAEQYISSKEVHMIDQLLIALNRENRGQQSELFADWLKEEWNEEQKLYGRYDRQTLKATVDYESLAVYYYLHAYFSSLGESEMADEVFQHTKEITADGMLDNAHFFDFIHYQLLVQKQ